MSEHAFAYTDTGNAATQTTAVPNWGPDAPRGAHVEVADAVFGEGVDEGIHDRGQGAGTAGFAAGLGAERIVVAGAGVGAGEARGGFGAGWWVIDVGAGR
jgi:hypothetical protein